MPDHTEDQPAAEPAPSPGETDAGPSPRRRCLTLRAILLGSIITIAFAILVPWNDWTLGNAPFYNNYLPPAVTLALLGIGLVLNPLLGRHRLHRGEVVVITIMLLGLGGVVSSGLNRLLPVVIGSTADIAAQKTGLRALREPLDEARVQAITDAARELAEERYPALDRDGSGLLDPAEATFSQAAFQRADADGDGRLSRAEFADMEATEALRRAGAIDDQPPWRWPLPNELFIGIPSQGPIDKGDPEYIYVVRGFTSGLGSDTERQRIGHRSVVSYSVHPGGEQHGPLPVLGGEVAAEYRRSERPFIDLDQGTGRLLRGLLPGQTALRETERTIAADGDRSLSDLAEQVYGHPRFASALATANDLEPDAVPAAGRQLAAPDVVEVTAVEPVGVPWYAWIGPLVAWAPLLLGAFVASVALAWLVRRQWIHHERLPYPIAEVTLSLMDEPTSSRHRLGALFRNRSFWIGLVIAGGVVIWNGLETYGVLVPVPIKTEINLNSVFGGSPWSLMPTRWATFSLKIFFSIIALSFFLSLELSFSIWFFFLLGQVGVMLLRTGGFPVGNDHLNQASTGGFFTMCLLILWIGRHYYWSVVKAAVGFDRTPEARRAAPFLWCLLIGCALMSAFLMAHGSPFWAAMLNVLTFLGFLLVFARIVAEAGIPFLQLPMGAGYNSIFLNLVGFGLPAAALMPLTVIGVTLIGDPREALLPYATNAGYLADRVDAPPKRTAALMVGTVAVGAVVSFAAMVSFAYLFGDTDMGHPSNLVDKALTGVDSGLAAQGNEQAAAQQASDRAGALTTYGFGAVTVGLLGAARMLFAAWPFHPIGFLTMASYPTAMIWFSVFLGWMCKLLVMRYGGTNSYRLLKPVAIGFIAGEALAMGIFLATKIVAQVFFHQTLPDYQPLPG